MASRRQRLVDLIGDLATHGVDQPTHDPPDSMREVYNDSKHKPQVPLLLARAISVAEQALIALRDICVLGITAAPSKIRCG